jgi:hypothetical protein
MLARWINAREHGDPHGGTPKMPGEPKRATVAEYRSGEEKQIIVALII